MEKKFHSLFKWGKSSSRYTGAQKDHFLIMGFSDVLKSRINNGCYRPCSIRKVFSLLPALHQNLSYSEMLLKCSKNLLVALEAEEYLALSDSSHLNYVRQMQRIKTRLILKTQQNNHTSE